MELNNHHLNHGRELYHKAHLPDTGDLYSEPGIFSQMGKVLDVHESYFTGRLVGCGSCCRIAVSILRRNSLHASSSFSLFLILRGCYDRFSLPVGTENRGGSEVGEILTAAHREFGGCAHRCVGKPKHRDQDRASPRRRGHARSGTAER